MENQNSSAAIISYEYSIEVSPTIHNICSYLIERDWIVNIYVESLERYRELTLEKTNIINLNSSIDNIQSKKNSFISLLKEQINNHNLIFAVDFPALDIINQLNIDLAKVIFLSFEGSDYLSFYNKTYAAELIAKCGLNTVQSFERGEMIAKYLNTNIDFEYLPVALRPLNFTFLTKVKPEPIRIIYSGYFAKWSCLIELLNDFKNCATFNNYQLVLQGHSMGTDYYLEAINSLASDIPNVTIDTSYYNNDDYYQMLRSYHLGLALYHNPSNSDNFEHLIFASGKIASYLWNGLAVITNIDNELTHQPPFLFLNNINEINLKNAIHQFQAAPLEYTSKAMILAQEKYNFDVYMEPIYQKLQKITDKG